MKMKNKIDDNQLQEVLFFITGKINHLKQQRQHITNRIKELEKNKKTAEAIIRIRKDEDKKTKKIYRN